MIGNDVRSAVPRRTLTLRVPADLHERIEAAAARERRSVHNWTLLALERAVREAGLALASAPERTGGGP